MKVLWRILFAIFLVVEFLVVLVWASPKSAKCGEVHDITYTNIIKEASCTEQGEAEIMCDICGRRVSTIKIEPLGHDFGEYVLVTSPSANKNGIEVRSCIVCNEKEEREVVCKHEDTNVLVITEASCIENGLQNLVCLECGTVLESNIVEALGHSFGDYTVLYEPSANKNGIEVRICTACSQQERREIICRHEKTETITKAPTCSDSGCKTTRCSRCHTILKEIQLQKIAHSYRDWVYSKNATPIDKGTRYKKCSYCGKSLFEDYEFSAPGEDYIYIPGTGINACVTVSSLTQDAVNRYDIVYTEHFGSYDPFVLGHYYGSLGSLYKTEIGEYIYLCIDGQIEIFEVVVSELALYNRQENDIVGQETGISIYHNYKCETLHLYTCYGYIADHRWIVIAKKI